MVMARVPFCLEGPAYLGFERPRRDEMRAAKGGQEVVQRVLVGEIDDAETYLELL